jgi:acyl-CoA thioesterase-1
MLMSSTVTFAKPGWFRALVIVAVTLATALLALLATPGRAAAPAAATRTGAGAPVIAVLGDSFSAGFGLAAGEGWVDLLKGKLSAKGYPHRVVNASISGDTTAGGRARIAGVLSQHSPAIVVIELGGNDGLRGGSLQAMKENLEQIIRAVRSARSTPLLVGIELPTNYGPEYTRRFVQAFAEVAKTTGTPLVPSIVAGFGDRLELFQADRIHPLPAAQPLMLEHVWAVLRPLLGKPRTAP